MAGRRTPVLERIAAMAAYQPGEQPRAVESLVKLNTNENPYPPSPRAVEAAHEALEGGLNLYPDPSSTALREAAAEAYGLRAEQVVVGNGSDEVLAMALRAVVGEGGRVLFSRPSYSLYSTLAAVVGARVEEVLWPGQLSGDGGAGLPENLFDAVTGADLCFVCSPNSPSGRAVAPEAISRLAAASPGLVVADEAYIDFGGDTALGLLSGHDNLLVTRSLSKSFSLAGMRLGLGLGSPALIEALAKTKDSYNVSRVAAAAGAAALKDMEWMAANRDRITATRERVATECQLRGYGVPASAANFLWMDCGRAGGQRVFEQLREAGVLVRYFDSPELGGGVRVSIGSDEDMGRFLAALPGPGG